MSCVSSQQTCVGVRSARARARALRRRPPRALSFSTAATWRDRWHGGAWAPSWSAGATTRDQPHTDEPAPFEAAEDSQPLINREAARDVVSASILAVSAARKQAADSVMSRHHSVLFFVQPSRFLVARSGAPIQDHILSRRDCRYLIARHGAPRRKEVPAGAQSGHRAITPRSVSRVSLTRRAAVSPPVFL